jgi:hypothetical protein
MRSGLSFDRFCLLVSFMEHGQHHVLSELDLLWCLGYSQRLPSLLDLHVRLQIVLSSHSSPQMTYDATTFTHTGTESLRSPTWPKECLARPWGMLQPSVVMRNFWSLRPSMVKLAPRTWSLTSLRLEVTLSTVLLQPSVTSAPLQTPTFSSTVFLTTLPTDGSVSALFLDLPLTSGHS